MHSSIMKPIDTESLLNALRAHHGGARWQTAAVLATPVLSAAVLAACGPITPRELGHLLALLARQGAPVVRVRVGAQSFWRVTDVQPLTAASA
jgi:hypothetical protein